MTAAVRSAKAAKPGKIPTVSESLATARRHRALAFVRELCVDLELLPCPAGYVRARGRELARKARLAVRLVEGLAPG